jgi:hypothetical protein
VQGRLLFHEYVVSRSGDSRDCRLAAGQIAAVRNAERRLQGPVVEMYSPYLEVESAKYETYLVPQAHVRPAFDGDATLFLHLVAEVTGVSESQMQSCCRDRYIASARRTAILAWRKLNRQTSEIAASLSISVPAATQLARRNADNHIEAEKKAAKVVKLLDRQRKKLT